MSSIDGVVDATVKQGENLRRLTITCSRNGSADDLSTADTITVTGKADRGTTSVLSRVPDDTANAATGVVAIDLTAGELAGEELWVEVVATWGDGTVRKYPGEGQLLVAIDRSIA